MTDRIPPIPLPGRPFLHSLPESFVAARAATSDKMNQTARRVHRVGAVLRLLQVGFQQSDDLADFNTTDLAELVDMMAEILPPHYQDIIDPVDEFDNTATIALRKALDESQKKTAILDAMTVAARADISPSDMEEAAKQVWDIVSADGAYEPDWQRFRAAVESRGFLIRIIERDGIVSGPAVMTPELVRLSRGTDRAVAGLVAAAHAYNDAAMRAPQISTVAKGKRA